MIRGDRHGSYQEVALEKGFAYHGTDLPDLDKVASMGEVAELLRERNPDAKEAQIRAWSTQIFSFVRRIKEGDLVAMPLRNVNKIAIGRVTGPYRHFSHMGEVHHTIPVQWLQPGISRTLFQQDLLFSLGSARTVCQIERNNAEARFQEILKGNKDPGYELIDTKDKTNKGKEDEVPTDIQQLAQDQIMKYIDQHFKGHDLAQLVEALLQAEGFITKLSPPGPDGGVDILAGRGALGMEGPKICVQVKSSFSPADVNILRALQGTMHNFKADQGLLVSWGGFTKPVENEARLSFFSVRLWDASDLIEALLKYYDRLPEDLQAELPLKRIWALVIEE